jgi:hypothetical protein
MSQPYEGDSTDPNVPGIKGTNSAQGGAGVLGESKYSQGVWGQSHSGGGPGVYGYNDGPSGDASPGVWGGSQNADGVQGVSTSLNGVAGESQNVNGVYGESHSAGGAGVRGYNDGPQGNAGPGVYGESIQFDGVHGESSSNIHAGVSGINQSGGPGVYGESTQFDGVHGESSSNAHAGVSGINNGGGPAGWFGGNVVVTGGVQLTGGDCAEQFEVIDSTCDAGSVMVIDDTGALVQSHREYDRRVAGVVSGAGDLRPGIILDKQQDVNGGLPIALLGKVHCKAVAHDAAIEVGDLLTTSSLAGHAMKATEDTRAHGAVIGKALERLPSGTGLIRILIALQ